MSLKQLFVLIKRENTYHVLVRLTALHKLRLSFLEIFCPRPAVSKIKTLHCLSFLFLEVSQVLIPTVSSFKNSCIFWQIDHCNLFALRWRTVSSTICLAKLSRNLQVSSFVRSSFMTKIVETLTQAVFRTYENAAMCHLLHVVLVV